MAQHGAVGAEHPVVPAHIFVQAEHNNKAQRQQAVTAHPQADKRLEQAEICRCHKAAEKIAEQIQPPEHLFIMGVGRGGFIVHDIADGCGKAVHDFIADVGGAVRHGGIVAKVSRHSAARHTAGDDGIGRAVNGVRQAVNQVILEVMEDAKILEIPQSNLDLVQFGEVLFIPCCHHQVGTGVEQDADAEIQNIVWQPQRNGNAGQIVGNIKAEVDAGTQVPLLGAGVHQPPGDKEIARQRGDGVEQVNGIGRLDAGHAGHDPRQGQRPDARQHADNHTHGAVCPFIHGHIFADLLGILGGDLFIQAVADDAANTEFRDGEKVEQLIHHLGCGGDIVAKVKYQQPPRGKAQQHQQQAGHYDLIR